MLDSQVTLCNAVLGCSGIKGGQTGDALNNAVLGGSGVIGGQTGQLLCNAVLNCSGVRCWIT